MPLEVMSARRDPIFFLGNQVSWVYSEVKKHKTEAPKETASKPRFFEKYTRLTWKKRTIPNNALQRGAQHVRGDMAKITTKSEHWILLRTHLYRKKNLSCGELKLAKTWGDTESLKFTRILKIIYTGRMYQKTKICLETSQAITNLVLLNLFSNATSCS